MKKIQWPRKVCSKHNPASRKRGFEGDEEDVVLDMGVSLAVTPLLIFVALNDIVLYQIGHFLDG